ncbi:MAG: multiheme c-type cytochrome [Verrucomicrobia bacterium]|nr:multiheme c-type cytochrome [Verrucomicrobiota bacterium]
MEPPPPTETKPQFRLLPESWAARAGVLFLLGGLILTTTSAVYSHWLAVPPVNRPLESVKADYVSSGTCRSCHPGNYASWHASFHRTMTQTAAPENFAGKMDGLELTYGALDYRVDRQDQSHLVRTKPKGSPSSAFGQPQAIVLLTGSHHLQIYWTETGEGRTMGQFPFAYVIAEKKWAPMEQTFLVPPGNKQVYDKGDWNTGCITCHATNGRSRPGENGRYDSQVSEFGISCEACHSGGREHIAQNRNPFRRFALHWSDRPDPTIANPARMDGPTATLACGQCHSISAYKDLERTKALAREGSNFRPGMKELDARWVAQPNSTDHPVERAELLQLYPHFFGDSFWPDGMIRVTGREMNGTMASPCYKSGKFSCMSCHELHPAKTDDASLATWKEERQMKPGMAESNQACLQCHQGMAAKLTAHTHHAADSSGSSCYNCHMPHSAYGLMRALRSHQISSPTVRESLDHGRPNACNLCHLDQPLAWTAAKLTEWYQQPAPKLEPDDRTLSAAAQWLLKGDAGQRALIVWSMGWGPAQKASGHEWFYPFLSFELNDPYAAVRYASWKSLQTLPGFAGHEFDYTTDDAKQKEALAQAYQKWWFTVRKPAGRFPAQTILQPNGMFQQDVFDRLLDQRSKRKILLAE